MKDLLKWGLIGLVSYWVYENFFVTPASATSTTTPAATSTAATAAPGFNSLASIYSRIVGSVPANSLFTAPRSVQTSLERFSMARVLNPI